MIGTSAWDSVFIHICIFVLHMIAPICVLYMTGRLLFCYPFAIPRLLEAWLAIEAAFYLAIYLPRRAYLQSPTQHPVSVCRNDRQSLFRRCLESIPDPEYYLKKWFKDAPAAEIKRENVKEFFRWAFLNKRDVNPEHDEELEEYTDQLEKLLGRTIDPGRGHAECLRLSVDSVTMMHRSLTWYLVSVSLCARET